MDSHPLSVLRHHHPALFRLYVEAERLVTQSPEAACVRLRVYAETIVEDLCARAGMARPRGIAAGLASLRAAPVPPDVLGRIDQLRLLGNRGAHPSSSPAHMNESSATAALAAAHHVGAWLATTHLGAAAADVNRFEPPPPSASQQVYQDAAHGDHEAQYQVGALLLHNAKRDLDDQLRRSGVAFLDKHRDAIEWFRKAQLAVPAARTKLAQLIWEGILPARDPDEAVSLLEWAAEVDDPAAHAALGYARLAGSHGLAVDHAAARQHFEAAAAHDNLEALNGLVKLYADGLGVPADTSCALTYARRAAEGGYATAQYNLALLLAKQGAVGADRVAEVVMWFTRSAEGGCAQAMHELYCAYRDGNGVLVDLAQAKKWRAAALEHDEPRTCFDMGLVHESGSDETRPDTLAALRCFERAARHAPDQLADLADRARAKMRLMVLRNRNELRTSAGAFTTDEFNDRIVLELASDDEGMLVPDYTKEVAKLVAESGGSPKEMLRAMMRVNPSAGRRLELSFLASRLP